MSDCFDFSYHDQLETERVGVARMTVSPVAEQPGRPTLVFIHGSMHGAWCYSNWLRACHENGYCATAIDLRGHGGLPTEDLLTAGFNDYADDTVAVARTFSNPPVLIGHSLGGVIAPLAATRTPAAGVVLLTPSPPANLPGAQPCPPVDETKPLPAAGEAMVREKFTPNHERMDISPMLERLCTESSVVMNDRYLLRQPVDPSKINAPALCISAGRDHPVTHPPGQDFAVGTFFGAENIDIPDAGHCLMLEPDWRQPLDIILDWYNREVAQPAS